MQTRSGLLGACAIGLFAVAAEAAEIAGAWLSVDLPPGGCRLMLAADGAGALNYGALPHAVNVPAGSFEFASVEQSLRRDVADTAQAGGSRTAGAGVVFDASGVVHRVEAEAYVRSLLERGWRARIRASTPSEASAHSVIASACGFSETD